MATSAGRSGSTSPHRRRPAPPSPTRTRQPPRRHPARLPAPPQHLRRTQRLRTPPTRQGRLTTYDPGMSRLLARIGQPPPLLDMGRFHRSVGPTRRRRRRHRIADPTDVRGGRRHHRGHRATGGRSTECDDPGTLRRHRPADPPGCPGSGSNLFRGHVPGSPGASASNQLDKPERDELFARDRTRTSQRAIPIAPQTS
jgi:hypothetical protein